MPGTRATTSAAQTRPSNPSFGRRSPTRMLQPSTRAACMRRPYRMMHRLSLERLHLNTQAILDKAIGGKRLTFDEGVALSECRDLNALGRAAHAVTRRL